jgi:hypothetical protein
MKFRTPWLLSLMALLAPSSVGAQGVTASLVDLGTNTVLSRFFVGRDCQAVAWAGANAAYFAAERDDKIIRVDMTTNPPHVTTVFGLPEFFRPHNIKVSPSGTRALVTGNPAQALYLDLTTSPYTILESIPVVPDANGIAFYAGGNAAVLVDEKRLLFLDLTTAPVGVTSLLLPINSLGDTLEGLDVAVNAAGTRAAATLDEGGFVLVDLTTSPPTFIGVPVGPVPADAQGVAISPDGTRAIYVDESEPTPEAIVVDITAEPVVIGSVAIPLAMPEPSAVVFNPATGAALISTDVGFAVLNPPYAAIDASFVNASGDSGTTPHAMSVNPAGTRAIILNEDQPIALAAVADTSVEDGGPMTTSDAVFVVTLTNTADEDILVDYQTADGSATAADSDYVATSGTLTIPADSISGQVIVTVKGDAVPEPTENFFLNLSTVSHARLVDNQGEGTIVDRMATPTMLSRFVAEPVEEGIELRWQFSTSADFLSSWAERARDEASTWSKVDGPSRTEADFEAVVDRGVEPGRTYRYRLAAERSGGGIEYFGPIEATARGAGTELSLAVSPIPASGSARVEFVLPRETSITLTITDIQGRVVETLASGVHTAGRHLVDWSVRGPRGVTPAGIYFVRLKTPDRSLVRRMTIAR